ncbi:hypothetical protein Mgra_00005089 [Meloidogyne graminicola]|uniref:VWFA domain-containing protein n=1 Tax=Meloidogyne graminicola TaxID=189291 RepID=A0A8S9ZPN4_9BILA|nr:hypothetical protein Mgra_00005089 [Meloidogyne graminicola]
MFGLAESGSALRIDFEPLKFHPVSLPSNALFAVIHSGKECNKGADSQYNQRVVECRLAAQVIAKKSNLIQKDKWYSVRTLKDVAEIAGLSEEPEKMLEFVKNYLNENFEEFYTREQICDILECTGKELEKYSLNSNTQDMQKFWLCKRAKHVFSEADRVLKFEEVCRIQDRNAFGKLAEGRLEGTLMLLTKLEISNEIFNFVKNCIMTIIIFLVDTNISMLQKTYLGTSFLDYAKLAIEQFLKQRQRDQASSGDRYMLMTFEEYPQNIKSGWKESQRIFNEQLKNLKVNASSVNFESSLDSVLRLLLVSRMQSGSGASIEAFGFGRYPSYAEHVVIIPVIDGSSLSLPSTEAIVPKPRLLTGSDLFVEGYRWDQRLFPIVLRIPGHVQAHLLRLQGVPAEDNSIAQNFAEQIGGRSFVISSHRTLGPCIDHILQKIQTNGVIIRFQKQGPDPPLPNGINENDQTKREKNNEWKNSLVLIKSKVGQQHSHWPIPEAFWPDSVKNTLPPRNAHPVVVFRCERVEPLFNTDFPLDKYELDSSSPLAQFILEGKETSLCWQVFVENSCRQPGLGFPFGYIKISTSATVTLYVMPYNYPELLSLLAMGKDPKIGTSHPQFQHKFDKYLRTVPAYYYSRLKNALSRIKVMPSCLEEANTKLYGYCNLVALQARIKHQGQQEFESACNAVHKNIQEATLLPPNAASFVKVSRSRTQLGKGSLTACTFRPAVSQFKSQIPADAFKDTNILLVETPSQTFIPSLQFKNPFDIPRINLYSQLEKMRLNFDQQVQTSNLHVLEGGLPGQKIKLQHAEDLHNLPIAKMGIYEEYMRSLNAIGLGPKRELEPQIARPHAFGNPFKLDKKNMSIVDEVGEMNNDEPSTSSSSSSSHSSSAERKEHRRREREHRAASEGPGSSNQVIRPKRRPGPLDLNRLAAWKKRRLSLKNNLNNNNTDLLEIQSAPPDVQDFDERNKLEVDEDEDEEDKINEMEEEEGDDFEEKGFEEVEEEEFIGLEQVESKNNYLKIKEENEQQPSSSTCIQQPLIEKDEEEKYNNNNCLIKRHVLLGMQVPPEEFVYEINPEGNMDMHVLFQNVHLIHHYLRTD